jgi:hypothetical protein
MAGLPTKYAKMGFKKGWKAYHAAHHYSTHKTMGGKHSGKKGNKVHHAIWLDGDISKPALISRPIKRISSITPGKIISPLVDLALIIIGMAAGAGLKKISPVKNPHIMNAGGAVVGVGGSLVTRNRFVKLPLLGLALQSSISEVKTLWPNLVPIAGDDEVVYLPMESQTPQIVYHGENERVGAVVDGEDDERVGAVVDGEDDGMSGEGRNC